MFLKLLVLFLVIVAGSYWWIRSSYSSLGGRILYVSPPSPPHQPQRLLEFRKSSYHSKLHSKKFLFIQDNLNQTRGCYLKML